MNAQGTKAALVLLMALASSQAEAAAARSLQLGFGPPAARPTHVATLPAAAPRASGGASLRNNSRTDALAPRKLGERALQSLLDRPEAGLDQGPAAGRMQLHFQRRGNAFRDLDKSYRELCNNVSAKVWDEPNGKRVRFDVAGKPGVGIEIPLR